MKDRFRLLAGAKGAAARQATLKAAIDWSWELLTPWEQAALAQCSVFEGGFTMEAAEAVLDLSACPETPPVMDAVQSLVDKSLLRAWVPIEQGRLDIDEPYFGMYLSIHEYAAAQLDASGDAATQSAQERHGAHFATFGTDEAIEALSRHGGAVRRRALMLEIDNLVAACTRAARRDDGGVAVASYRAAWEVLNLQGPLGLAVRLGGPLLALDSLDASTRAQACRVLGMACNRTGNSDASEQHFLQALALARQLGDRQGEGKSLGQLGWSLHGQGRLKEAQQHLEASLAVHREVSDRSAEGAILSTLGVLLWELGRPQDSLALRQQSIAIHQEVGNRSGEGSVHNSLACMLAEQGRLHEAAAHFAQALVISREVGDRIAEGQVFTNLGCMHQEEGRFAQAQSNYDASLAIHRAVGNRRFEGYALGDLGRLSLEQGEFAAAQDFLERSLAIMRETGDRRIEGSELRSLAELFIRQRRLDAAREVLVAGESVLRQVGDKFYLAFVLCGRAEWERLSGDAAAALATCAEAESIAAAIHAGPGSELGRKLAALRAVLITPA
jgi:tetratricopeptide (TPR) repeat protein